jgi:hypothetical protein
MLWFLRDLLVMATRGDGGKRKYHPTSLRLDRRKERKDRRMEGREEERQESKEGRKGRGKEGRGREGRDGGRTEGRKP